jgi:chorismate dehydratase
MLPGLIFAPKNRQLGGKIKVAGVSYLNTKPLLYGIDKSDLSEEMELTLDYPARVAQQLKEDSVDIALLPVAVIPEIPGARIVCDYGIGADGEVASVCIFSRMPIEEVRELYLDYQSRTSVRLAQILLRHHWKQEVICKPAPEHYIEYLSGTTAGVIIGDRALQQHSNFEYVYDLAAVWKEHTGLPFLFAAWVANKDLPAAFLEKFNAANALGLAHIPEVVAQHPFPYYDLDFYYRNNISYRLDEAKHQGMQRFLSYLKEMR